MQFIDNAPLYRIIRITGPTHNLLGLQLSTTPIDFPPVMETLNPDSKNSDLLVGAEVLEQVVLGIDNASRECGQKYFVEKVQYLTTDSLPVTIYSYLAAEIIRKVQMIKK